VGTHRRGLSWGIPAWAGKRGKETALAAPFPFMDRSDLT
jgi:hypothetical protein